ncbi:SagB-type dehydrogenase domain protein [Anaerohalosphaera lusitana]|uniref:SagB-type dehydrogenase domain protein n=1 Tax=Anaerohalosphaera lusitana TaxID=1936003 RepID=A0A1U9NPU0_9BACT|nr:SagB/ThcOx family dehydrogenase [Anaerohalosphaera lusitana]AQT69738.1 SagB-type dehydrogenase domain protein [Anaerohalosphaera lusitana]
MHPIEKNRKFLRADDWKDLSEIASDQQKGVQAPPVEKPYDENAKLIDLTPADKLDIGHISLFDAIQNRKSHRRFKDEHISLNELSFLLWATQGVRRVTANGVTSFRNVPSAGSRHALETYLVIRKVEGLQAGLYRYLPVEHKLELIRTEKGIEGRLAQACCGQTFIATAAVSFVWTSVPYRMEWRYTVASPKLIALDAGHIAQNLYLAVEAINAGTCAIAAYFQDQVDHVIGLDGKDEFAVYIAPVGKV